MAFFGSRPSLPIDERERALNEEIARLEKEIAGLKSSPTKTKRDRDRESAGVQTTQISSTSAPSVPVAAPVISQVISAVNAESAVAPVPLPPTPPPSHPALVATALKSKPPVGLTVPVTSNDPHFNDFGVRKFDVKAWWENLLGQWRRSPSGPANPEMVKYLATGSVQGLRPLRFERRVARNRTIGLVAVLVVILYGLAWVFLRN